MVLFALDDNNKIILAKKANKYYNYKCNYCKEKLFYVSKSRDKKSYFRHKESHCNFYQKLKKNKNLELKKNIYENKFYTNLINPKYLYYNWYKNIFYNN